MELSTFNPYSGKFAGYNITKGKLTTELHYKVDGRKLDAQHHIMVDQLEFGDKTESKDAVSLPIKLAVALLKDRNGVIDLDIPVTGSLDDPQVQAGPDHLEGVRQYSGKSRHRAVRAAGLAVRRRPGSAVHRFRAGRRRDSDAAAADKVQAMVKALNERPQLKIEVPIAWVDDLDRPALVEAQFAAAGSRGAVGEGGPRRRRPTAAPTSSSWTRPASSNF